MPFRAHAIGRHRRSDRLIVIALLVFGILLVVPYTDPNVRWAPDSLFYLAQKREIQGEKPGRRPARGVRKRRCGRAQAH